MQRPGLGVRCESQGSRLQQEPRLSLVIGLVDKIEQGGNGIEQPAHGAGIRGVATEAPQLVQVADPLDGQLIDRRNAEGGYLIGGMGFK
ncbi:hypothetical protein D3C78_1770190 [compost metagenome]